MQKQREIRNILSEANLDYKVKVINRGSPSPFASGSRAHTGTFGQDISLSYEYTFYVLKKDYDKAKSNLKKYS